MMPFSVLMSVYKNDNEDYLRAALESIYEMQTLKPNEIVIVFDGPLTDGLYQTIGKFCIGKGNIVRTVPIEKNCGLGEALRTGAGHCSHEYIMRMDADDISDPKRFEKQMAYVGQHPHTDVLGTCIAEFTKNWNGEDMRLRRVPSANADICRMSKKRNPMNHVSACIKKSALVQCGGYESILLVEDYYLWLKMIASGCILENLEDVLVYVRTGKNFSERRGAKERIQGWKVLQAYMLDHHMISWFGARLNMLYIFVFTHMPSWFRSITYSLVLRRHTVVIKNKLPVSREA